MPKLLITLLLALPFTALAGEWQEYTSENFVIYSDADTDRIKARIVDFEVYRQAVLLFLGFSDSPETINARVYIFKNINEFKGFTRSDWIAGYYQYLLNGPTLVMPERVSKDKRRQDEEKNLVMFHEYVHYLLRERTGINYPRWYDEGLSDLLGAAKISDGKIGIGASNPWRHSAATGNLRLEVKQLIEKPGKGNWRHMAGYYPSSWLLTHYLMLGHLDGEPDYSAALQNYLSAYADGDVSVADFEKHLGVTTAQLDKALVTYARKGYLKGYSIPIRPYSGKITQRLLGDNEMLYHKANLLIEAGREIRAKTLLQQNSQKNQPYSTVNQSLLAVLEGHEGKYDLALQQTEEALKLAGDDPLVLTHATHAMTDKLAALKEKNQWDEELYKRAFELGLKAYAHPQRTLEPVSNLWNLYDLKGDSLNVVKMMMEIYRETPSRIDLNMSIGSYLADSSTPKLALPFLEKVIAFSHDDDLKEKAGEVIERIYRELEAKASKS
jgi:tetratricopeptide (TPR) repeat protein